MKVYLNTHTMDGKINGRRIVEAEVLQRNKSTVIVRLPDGHIISRRFKDQVVQENVK